MAHPKGYVDSTYLQTAAALLKPVKYRTYELMHIQPGHRVLDVGCGSGVDTIALAQWVGSMGQVVGIDYDVAMVAEADQRATEAEVNSWVIHKQAQATELPLESGSFDACRSERLFQHLHQPDQALSEMLRVTKSGGWIVILDTDTCTVSIDSDEIDIERRLCRFYSEHRVWNGYSGRQLYRRFKRHHLADVTVEILPVHITDYNLWRFIDLSDETEREALAAGILTPDELQRWHSSLEQADALDGFFACFIMVMVAGRNAA